MPLWIDSQSERDHKRWEARRSAYVSYLSSIANYLPAETAAFALSDWYYSDSDRNPHDGWVENIEIKENATGDRQQFRTTGIELRLLAAHHKAHIIFRYNNVVSYNFERPLSEEFGHGDWLSDEITLGSNGTVIHEIVFARGARWKIESAAVSYEYVLIG